MQSPLWFEGVRLTNCGETTLVALYAEGREYVAREVALSHALSVAVLELPRRTTQLGKTRAIAFRDVELSTADRLLHPGRLRRRVLPGTGASNRHAIFKLAVGDEQLYLPALLLMRLLFLRSTFFANALFRAHSLDLLVRPGTTLRDGRIALSLGQELPSHLICADNVRTLAWLAVCTDARRAWDSVAHLALSGGRIDLELPEVRIDGWVWGVETGDGVLASIFGGLRLTFPLPVREVVVVATNHPSQTVSGTGRLDSLTSFGRRWME